MHQAELLEKMTHLSESIEESLMEDYKIMSRIKRN